MRDVFKTSLAQSTPWRKERRKVFRVATKRQIVPLHLGVLTYVRERARIL